MNTENIFEFEYDIVSHCNLNCASCTHFSPVAEEEFVLAQKAEKELLRISEIFEHKCYNLRIMGGEPLLNPELCRILEIARKCFTKGRISLVTNGILLSSQPDDFWKICHNNNIDLCITKYDININERLIMALSKIHNVKIFWYRNGSKFIKYALSQKGNNDISKTFNGCFMGKNCPQYNNGKLYHCSVACYVYRLNKAFNRNFEVCKSDYIDVFEDITAEDIYKYLSEPIPFCKYCNPQESEKNNTFSWHISKRLPDEWIDE